jgi:hypothetical protein
MAVTAKLSKRFYERLGDEIANELVDWFNSVDAAYKSDLRDLNEVNFARFDAKLEQRLAEFREEMNAKFDGLRIEMNSKFDGLRIEMNSKFDSLRNDVNARIGGLEVQIERSLKEQTRFYFLAWAVLLASNIALWFRR